MTADPVTPAAAVVPAPRVKSRFGAPAVSTCREPKFGLSTSTTGSARMTGVVLPRVTWPKSTAVRFAELAKPAAAGSAIRGIVAASTRLFPVSAMRTVPYTSTATAAGATGARPQPPKFRSWAFRALSTTTMRLLPGSAMNTLPAWSKAIALGAAKAEGVAFQERLISTPVVEPAATVTTRLLPASAMWSMPAALTARPWGDARVEGPVDTARVRVAAAPPGVTSTIWLLPVSAMKRSPDASRATPRGADNVTAPVSTTVAAPLDATFTTRLLPVSAM